MDNLNFAISSSVQFMNRFIVATVTQLINRILLHLKWAKYRRIKGLVICFVSLFRFIYIFLVHVGYILPES
jgi:hypothetical protein